ncbi:MAG: GIY-YIG nuclease family protein [Elusimicrobia bacterium]|nr:GIY-YIG nuclease family protein [Elusimicrobiota bacterium]
MAKRKKRGPREWAVYILRCGDRSLYTGITKDIEARLLKHRAGKGAAYTRTHLPVELVYRELGKTRSEALVCEARIKTMPKARKEALLRPPQAPDTISP